MLFIFVLSLLHLTLHVSPQVTSESEAINKIINNILSQVEKKNADSIEFIWNDEFTVHERKSTKRYKVRNSKKPRIDHNRLSTKYQKSNPTLKLRDVIPELNTFYTQPVRNTRTMHTTKASENKIASITQSSETKILYDMKTTLARKKKPKQKTKPTSFNTTRYGASKPQLIFGVEKPAHNEDIYYKFIPTGPREHQFSKEIIKTQPTKTEEITEDMSKKWTKTVTKAPKFTSTTTKSPQNKLSENTMHNEHHDMMTTSRKNLTNHKYGHHSPASYVTEKDWRLLEEAENYVKSIPNYEKLQSRYSSSTTTDQPHVILITSDMKFNYGKEDVISTSKKHITPKLFDKRVIEDKEIHTLLAIDVTGKYDNANVNVDATASNTETVDTIDKRVTEDVDKEKYVTFKHNVETDGIVDLFTEKTTAKFFDKMVTGGKETSTRQTTHKTFKYGDAIDVTFKHDNNVDMIFNHNTITDDFGIRKESLNQPFLYNSATPVTQTTKNYKPHTTTMPLDNTEKKFFSTPTHDTSTRASTDLYLLVDKNKALKSYFTLDNAYKNIKTSTDNAFDYEKMFNDLGIDTTTEYDAKMSKSMFNNIDEIQIPQSPIPDKIEAEKKSEMEELYKDVIEKYESIKEERIKPHEKPQKFHEKVTKHFNWENIKKFFGHDRVCNCKCKANKTMCTVCGASDAVMRELAFEFNNLADYMNSHCTEIQTFFWMNPSGGKKLRDTVHRIDKTLQDYYKRVKGKCEGRTCKTFATYLDKRRYSDKMKYKRKFLRELLRDLEVK